MAKRLVDTGFITQPWVLRLPTRLRYLFKVMLDVCDCVGTFEPVPELLTVYVGEKITLDDVYGSFGNRVIHYGDKALIVDFVEMQTGGCLSRDCKGHAPIFKRLAELGLTVARLRELSTKHRLQLLGDDVEPLTAEPDNVGAVHTVATPPPVVVIQQPTEELPHLQTVPAKPKRGRKGASYGYWFDKFWAAYPRKDGKKTAAAKFEIVMRGLADAEKDALLTRMLAAIMAQCQSEQWIKDGGQFIPWAQKWLHNRYWENEGVKMPEAPVEKQPLKMDFKPEDWLLCKERCACWDLIHNCCGCGCKVPPQFSQHPHPPEECKHFKMNEETKKEKRK